MNELKALKEELEILPLYECVEVKFSVNKHLWRLRVVRGKVLHCLYFMSPKGREYGFATSSHKNHVIVGSAYVRPSRGPILAEYEETSDSWREMDKIIRNTPKHVIEKVVLMLDALSEA